MLQTILHNVTKNSAIPKTTMFGLIFFLFVLDLSLANNQTEADSDTGPCIIDIPKMLGVYVFKHDWVISKEQPGIEFFWEGINEWCGNPGIYEYQCGNGELAGTTNTANVMKAKLFFPKTFKNYALRNCSVRAKNENGSYSEWSEPSEIDMGKLKPAPWIMTATYKEAATDADAALVSVAEGDVHQYMHKRNKEKHGPRCSKWPMIQDYNCCYAKTGMVLRPLHKRSVLVANLQFPEISCSTSNQVFDFCLDWVGWITYEIRECPHNSEKYCIHPTDNTKPWVLPGPIYQSKNPIQRILCNPFRSRIYWIEKMHVATFKIYQTDNHVQEAELGTRCSCLKHVSIISPAITLDWSTYYQKRYNNPAIIVIAYDGLWQIIVTDTPQKCTCNRLINLPSQSFAPIQIATDWNNFYWMSKQHKIFAYDWKTAETSEISRIIDEEKFGKIVQLQSCNAEMRKFSPKYCYYPDFTVELNMVERTSGHIQAHLKWNNSEECSEISKPATTFKVFHAPSDYTGQCHHSNPLFAECPMNYDLRNRKIDPKFGISELSPNKTYIAQVWVQPFHHYYNYNGRNLYPYGPSPYSADLKPNPFGWFNKSNSFDTFFVPKQTVPVYAFVLSIVALIALLIIVVASIWLYYSYKWRKFKDIPRISPGQLQSLDKLGAGHFGDVKREKYKNKTVATKYLKETAGDYEERCFLEEIRILWFCQSPHIVTMLGICVSKRPYRYVMELVNGSSFEEILWKKRSQVIGIDDMKLFMRSACEINQACIHLENLNVIHRDLAVRNCLASLDKSGNVTEVKLTDFGLAKELDRSKGRYEIPQSALSQRELPTALLAPECMKMGVFDLATEVWAFGVFLWEVYSLAELPYAGMRHGDIQEHIRKGYRLEKPELCPDPIYDLMKTCWSFEPANRPGFKRIYECLRKMKDNRKTTLSTVLEQRRSSAQSQVSLLPNASENSISIGQVASSSAGSNDSRNSQASEGDKKKKFCKEAYCLKVNVEENEEGFQEPTEADPAAARLGDSGYITKLPVSLKLM